MGWKLNLGENVFCQNSVICYGGSGFSHLCTEPLKHFYILWHKFFKRNLFLFPDQCTQFSTMTKQNLVMARTCWTKICSSPYVFSSFTSNVFYNVAFRISARECIKVIKILFSAFLLVIFTLHSLASGLILFCLLSNSMSIQDACTLEMSRSTVPKKKILYYFCDGIFDSYKSNIT